MMTVHEVSELTGVSIRTLQYYDQIGLLQPAQRTEAGYRLYDDTALERLRQILLFRELAFSLDEIKAILDAPDFDREKALDQQIELLTLKRERLDAIIALAREIRNQGELPMKFQAFDETTIQEYAARAKAEWGSTKEYEEYVEKSKSRSMQEEKNMAQDLMGVFVEFGAIRDMPADCDKVKAQVQKLQNVITNNYYHCSNEMLASLGQMYIGNEEFRQNIDKAGGEGTAAFVSRAIEDYCK